jgi:hypothetical protein
VESKIELTERLRREGRWEEASRFKDEAVKDLRSKGIRRAEANEQAWEAMAEKFPPLPTAQQTPEPAATAPDPGPSGSQTAAGNHQGLNARGAPAAPALPGEDVDIDTFLDRAGDRPSPDLVRDTLWAYENLSNRRATPGDAPSLGAWSLLQWARQYKNRFFEQVLPRAMAAHDSNDEQNERTSIAEIERILEGLNQQWAEELVANLPETVRAKVRSILEDWARRSALTIPSEAKADLEAHLGRLVQDCVDALAPASRGE